MRLLRSFVFALSGLARAAATPALGVVAVVQMSVLPNAGAAEGPDGSYQSETPMDIMQAHKERYKPKTRQEALDATRLVVQQLVKRQRDILEGKRLGLTRPPAASPRAAIGGRLWAFWAIDAPQSRYLGRMLGEVRVNLPSIDIKQVHVMPLQNWHIWFKQIQVAKDRILQLARSDRIGEAKQLGVEMIAQNGALKSVTRVVGRDSVSLYEDVSAAIAFNVQSYPTVIYVSPSGRAHRLVGAGKSTSLPLWIARCLAWEVAQDAEVKIQRPRRAQPAPVIPDQQQKQRPAR